MKLVLAGASGFVGTELITQALQDPKFTSIVGLTRRPLGPPADLPAGTDTSKFQNVVVDYANLSDEAKSSFKGAGALIWNASITPNAAKENNIPMSECKRVRHDLALNFVKTVTEFRGPSNHPLRFVYNSGVGAERDQNKTPQAPPEMQEYCHITGAAEVAMIEFGKKQNPVVEVCSTNPGAIDGPGRDEMIKNIRETVPWLPVIGIKECVAAMLDQLLNGFEKDLLLNDDLIRIGQRVLKSQQ